MSDRLQSAADAAPNAVPARKRRWPRRALCGAALIWAVSAIWHSYKPLPEGVSAQHPLRAARDVALLSDVT